MSTEEPATGSPTTWFEAVELVLDPLLRAQSLLALVTGAQSTGLLSAARTPATAGELSAASGLSGDRVRDVVRALVAAEVLEEVGAAYRLAPAWAMLTGPAAFAPLGQTLRAADVDARALRALAGDTDFWTLPAEDRDAYARAVSPDPFAPGLVAAFRGGAMTAPDVRARLLAGAPHLELGCGLAGRILCLLQAYPRMTAVGVERAPDLAAEARRRAEALGVADRFEVVVGDAADVAVGTGPLTRQGFETAQWSQFFFPQAARAGALRTMFDALAPGGLLEAPLLGDQEAMGAAPHGPDARNGTLVRVVHGSWGIPERSPAQLVAEVTEAGFVDAVATRSPGGALRLLARRP